MAAGRNAGREIILDSATVRSAAVSDGGGPDAVRVLGFDCSSKTVGWGLVAIDSEGVLHLNAHGHIRPLPSRHDLMTRLSDLFDRVSDLCRRLGPHVVAVEDIALFMKGGGSTARTITTLASFNRIVALAAFRQAGALEFYPVQSIRKLVRQAAGRKKVIGKDEMPAVIATHLDFRFSGVEKRGGGRAEQTFDEADGIAAAWAHAFAHARDKKK
jgi:Holliday junction resolvasome RuvABC endonuclease subunit